MRAEYIDICSRSLNGAKQQNYCGYSKFDALNSPVLWALAARSRFLRAGFVFAVSRSPINIRPLLFVRKKQNPKGLGLFARAYFNLYQATNDSSLKDEGLRLLKTLLTLSRRDEFSGHCWGYDHPWQNVAFFIPAYEPNCVVTCAAGEAFLQAYHLTGDNNYLGVCESIAEFILKDLKQIDVGPDMRCCSYDLKSSWKVINVNAMASVLLAKIYSITQKNECKEASQKMMRWVISQKTDYHTWYYTDPPDASRITHDNYHTGFVLDSILDYLEVFSDTEIEQAWFDGLEFYKSKLFTDDYAPKWMYDRTYPHDIHGAAQGVITFCRAAAKDLSCRDISEHILEWTLSNLYDPKTSRFYYQKSKAWTKRFTLMRWSQAWMCYAMSVYICRKQSSQQSS